MINFTIIYTTARLNCEFDWFLDSISSQCKVDGSMPQIIIVDYHYESRIGAFDRPGFDILHVPPKPTIWQGKHRLTSEDWWAMSNGRNTGICLAKTDWVGFVDDRCVAMPTWMAAAQDAMNGQYIALGGYEKHINMKVENGVIVDPGEVSGVDNRIAMITKHPMPATGHWCYGCSIVAPMSWLIAVGGFEQALDGMSAEDTTFGAMLQNSGFPMFYDVRLSIVEDRTTGGTQLRREDKGISPNDKSHKALELFNTATNTTNRHHLLQSRAAVQNGEPFPVLLDPPMDWYDGEPINHNYMKR